MGKPGAGVALIVLLGLGLPGTGALAYEVDDFTHRFEPLQDSADALNREINRRIAEAVQATNDDADSACDRKALFENLTDEFGVAQEIGAIESFAEDSDEVFKTSAEEPHIYTDPKRSRFSFLGAVGIEPSVRVDGHFFGIDKLGHFFSQGYTLFEEMPRRARALKNAHPDVVLNDILRTGMADERGIHGMGSTGIMSYGDLAANYSGYRFWSRVLDAEDPGKSYVRCVNGRFERGVAFDLREYADDSWDEGINCSEFDDKVGPVFRANLAKLKMPDGQPMKCPVDAKRCQRLRHLQFSPQFISPACWNAGDALDRAEEALKKQAPHCEVPKPAPGSPVVPQLQQDVHKAAKRLPEDPKRKPAVQDKRKSPKKR